MIPTLTTPHLTLGPLTCAHLDAFTAFCATDASRFLGGPAEAMDAQDSCLAGAGQWVLRGFGPFWLTDRATGAPTGRAGVTFPPHRSEPELAWVIYPAFQNRGLATEAATAARQWAAEARGLTGLMSVIDEGNAASIRVAEKLGAAREAAWPSETAGKFLWRHPRGLPA
jgi:RimJ/RimL family protein N-acetyltransferase